MLSAKYRMPTARGRVRGFEPLPDDRPCVPHGDTPRLRALSLSRLLAVVDFARGEHHVHRRQALHSIEVGDRTIQISSYGGRRPFLETPCTTRRNGPKPGTTDLSL